MLGKQRRIVYDRNEGREFVKGNTWGLAQGRNPDVDEILQLWVFIAI